MRKTLVVLVAMMMVGMTIPAFAELQNVKVGGSLRIRGNWYSGDTRFDDDAQGNNDALYIEQRTTVNVSASFTDNVKAFVDAIMKAKPAGAKGTYINKISLSSTMGPGIKINPADALAK